MKLVHIQDSVNEIIEKLHLEEGNVDIDDFKIVKSSTDNSYEVNILFKRKGDSETYGVAIWFD